LSKSDTRDGRTPVAPGAAPQPELVDPKWLLKAGALTVLAAAVVAYLASCLLFYQGQWQLVLHPGPMQPVPAKLMPPHEDVRFAVDSSGQPTLHGWWIPAGNGAPMQADVLVYFPGGSGALSSRTDKFTYLHRQQINIFAFDYRGYGDSETIRPSQQSIAQDALATVQYLTQTRHVPLAHMIFYGEGIGCFAAVRAAAENPGVAAIIFSDPELSQRPVFESDGRTHLLPLNLLLRDVFSLEPDLSKLQTQTLVLSTIGTSQSHESAQQVYAAVHAPKQILQAKPAAGPDALTADFDAFLRKIFPVPGATPAAPESAPATTPRREK
jgi:pimeloyl-ACP methyl ester carboxylesterase